MFALLLVAGLLVFSPVSDQYLSGRSENLQQGSTVAREILWQASLNIALDHPILGIGSDKFNSVSTQYQSSVDSSYIAYEKREYWSYRTLGNEPPHNDFLNTWVSYGVLALIVFIGLFILIIRIFLNSYNISRNGFVKGISLGFAAAFIAYGINSLYHNMLSTSPLFWILAGFALAISKLAVARTASVDNRISERK
jgi:O-antigen ligase